MKHFDKAIETRLSCIEGHVRGVKEMVSSGADCNDVIMQLSAIEGAVSSLAKILIKEHLNHCVKESIEKGEEDVLNKFGKILDKYL